MFEIDGLENGQNWKIEVAAVNSIGLGELRRIDHATAPIPVVSSPSSPTTPPGLLPAKASCSTEARNPLKAWSSSATGSTCCAGCTQFRQLHLRTERSRARPFRSRCHDQALVQPVTTTRHLFHSIRLLHLKVLLL
jgi:hypothetical protein